MKFAKTIDLIALISVAFAATNAAVTVSPPTTNTVSAKVFRKVPKPSRPQCEATTLSGNRCTRHATEGSNYCSQHAAILRKREKEAKAKGAARGLSPSCVGTGPAQRGEIL